MLVELTSPEQCVLCCQVIFGGRDGVGYFDDVWAFRLSTGQWESWTPTNSNAASPMGRDHFGAVYDSGHMYIYGEPPDKADCMLYHDWCCIGIIRP